MQQTTSCEAMSGYDPSTGVFELSPSQVHRWLRVQPDPAVQANDSMRLAAEVLRSRGLEVLFCASNNILVRSTQGPIWEALSGLSATSPYPFEGNSPSHYSATYLSHLVVPPMSAAAFNRRVANAGLARRTANGWVLTETGEPFGSYVSFGGRGSARGVEQRVIHWTLGVLDLLRLPWPRPSAR